MAQFEELTYAKQGLLPRVFDFYRLHKLVPALEPAHLVELGCIGKIGFGDDSKKFPLFQQQCAVVEPALEAHRGAYCQQQLKAFGGLEHLCYRFFGGSEEPFLGEEVGTAVAGDAEFREDENGSTVASRLSGHADYFCCIFRGIGQPYPWRGCRYPEETVRFACHITQI